MPRSSLLTPYRAKRNFRKTPEPLGGRPQSKDPIFVIQKHDASHLHYDFRLEADGVLKSWAVPKGPSMDPSVKRLAVEVEDHPLDYAGFEGIIPQGQYGGGNVIVWDRGTYENHSQKNGQPLTLSQAIDKGHITIDLHGEKVRGRFALTRMHFQARKPQWLLVKMQDAEANQEEPVETHPESVISGRTVESLSQPGSAKKPVRVWLSNQPTEASMPKTITPMLATLIDEPFSRAGWIYEPKLDGERCIAYREGPKVHLVTRNQKPLNTVYPELVEILKKQSSTSFILDGEVVAYEPGTKRPSFRRLQQRMHLHSSAEVARSTVQINYCLFDILYRDGHDLRKLPLSQRKALLEQTIKPSGPLELNPFVDTKGDEYYHRACRQHWEGVIAKRFDAPYIAGRTRDWVKFKCLHEQEFVIGGYTDPQGTRESFGAVLLGYYEGKQLHYAGKVGTGFDTNTLAILQKKLKAVHRETSPFVRVDIPRRGLHWVEPKLVAQIGFAEWTEDGKLRQSRFYGLRDDKAPEDVVREKPIEKSAVTAQPAGPVTAPARASAPKAITSSKVSTLKVEGKTLNLSNLNKVFYPSTGFTKGQMIDYYIKVAPAMLPHLNGRPLTLKRYPEGVAKPFFYEKQAPAYKPSWLKTYAMKDEKTGNVTRYCVITDLASLTWVVNLASLELHTLLAREPKVDTPTMIAFDLDPGAPATMMDCLRVGLWLKETLDQLKLKSFPKVSGSKGLHVYIPLNTPVTYEQTQGFAHSVALYLEQQHPQEIVSNMRKELRKGKVLVDWSQNTRHKTTVAVYSLRAQEEPSVSCPVTWEEVQRTFDKKNPASLRFTPEHTLDRIRGSGDLFAPLQTLRQKLPKLGNFSSSPVVKKTQK